MAINVGFGRFVDGTRQLAALVAGSLAMPPATFVQFNLLGAVVWVAVWSLGPVFFERHVARSAATLHALRPVLIAAAVVAVVLAVRWLRHGTATHTSG